MTLGVVWAQAAGGVIGRNGTLPWHLPEDLAHFRALTAGATVIMGRRTWQSLPPRFRPLPGRHNIVISSDPACAEGATVVPSLAAALAAVDGTSGTTETSAWVIGGGAVYRTALPHATTAVITEIDALIDGDTHAPVLDDGWRLVSADPEHGWHRSGTGLSYRICRYTR
jgi:dihydrofolate reductase